MNADKSSLVQRLILAVLALILVCLIVLIAQLARRPDRQADMPAPAAQNEMAGDVAIPSSEVITYRPVTNRVVRGAPTPLVQAAPVPVVIPSSPAPVAPGIESGLTGIVPPPVEQAVLAPLPEVYIPPSAAAHGTFMSGRVWLRGSAPPEKQIPVGTLCGPHPKPLTTRFYVTSPEGGLANVFVYVRNPPRARYVAPDAAVLYQVDCEFQPYVMGIMTGQKLGIKNSDVVAHNVSSGTSSNRNHRFNVMQMPQGLPLFKSFDKPELPVKLMCNVHRWMFAFVGVFDHPYFAVTDTNGVYRLPPALPRGTYFVTAKHMKAGEVTFEVNITDPSQALNFDFELSPPAEAAAAIQKNDRLARFEH